MYFTLNLYIKIYHNFTIVFLLPPTFLSFIIYLHTTLNEICYIIKSEQTTDWGSEDPIRSNPLMRHKRVTLRDRMNRPACLQWLLLKGNKDYSLLEKKMSAAPYRRIGEFVCSIITQVRTRQCLERLIASLTVIDSVSFLD